MKPKILTGRVNGCSSYTHLYPTFLALHAASARLSMRYHLRSSELYSLPRGDFCDGGPLSWVWRVAKCSISHDGQGREQGEWLEAKGMAGARRYGRMWLGDPSPDSRQGDSSSLEVYHSDRVLPYTRILASFYLLSRTVTLYHDFSIQ
jgi:hypothetical protein